MSKLARSGLGWMVFVVVLNGNYDLMVIRNTCVVSWHCHTYNITYSLHSSDGPFVYNKERTVEIISFHKIAKTVYLSVRTAGDWE